ncbi:pyruvate ferredoxin oxidoreductase, partial [Akkermansiaceae bacterium]|nr:pyruvate ferredoxin oxidoreductase [Akkermansiaceae bacterium]
TTPLGRKSKTDPRGAIDQPINPMAQLVASGATFIARTHAAQVKHMNAMFERAILHPGFAVVETLSECTMFYPGAFDDGNPRKGGTFDLVDEETQEMDSISAAMNLSQDLSPGKFGVYYEAQRATKNELERAWLSDAQKSVAGMSEQDILRQRFASMR